ITLNGKDIRTIPLKVLLSQISYVPQNNFLFSTSIRSEEHTSELQSRFDLVCRLLLEKKSIHHRVRGTCLSSLTAGRAEERDGRLVVVPRRGSNVAPVTDRTGGVPDGDGRDARGTRNH